MFSQQRAVLKRTIVTLRSITGFEQTITTDEVFLGTCVSARQMYTLGRNFLAALQVYSWPRVINDINISAQLRIIYHDKYYVA